MNEYTVLVGQIQEWLVDLKRVIERIERLLQQAQKTGDRAYLEATALYLHSFYSGAEQIFVEIARTLGETVPTHETWHKMLLRQMAAQIESVRPAVISTDSRDCLENYRSFRHIVRNVYTFNLIPQRIIQLAEEVPACHQQLSHDLEKFMVFLRQVPATYNKRQDTL